MESSLGLSPEVLGGFAVLYASQLQGRLELRRVMTFCLRLALFQCCWQGRQV